jgi:hypothetical protein
MVFKSNRPNLKIYGLGPDPMIEFIGNTFVTDEPKLIKILRDIEGITSFDEPNPPKKEKKIEETDTETDEIFEKPFEKGRE